MTGGSGGCIGASTNEDQEVQGPRLVASTNGEDRPGGPGWQPEQKRAKRAHWPLAPVQKVTSRAHRLTARVWETKGEPTSW